MWYIYEENGVIKYSKDKPSVDFIELAKMPPIESKPKTIPILKADFNIGKVWYEYERVYSWNEPSKKLQKEEIILQLEELDRIVDRQWEDYYIRENITPVERIATVIAQKEELRQRMNSL